MSLFKVRDFWSFDLDHLRQHTDDRRATSPTDTRSPSSPIDEDAFSKAQFVVSVGRFGSIGDQDVFVCGDLEGHIYIIQVPESDQQKFIKNADTASVASGGEGGQNSTKEASNSSIGERQLLAATSLSMLLVDLKCGYFTSALKQSIAALSSDKLIIMTVKRRQIDLLTGPIANEYTRPGRLLSLDENLLTHELEEFIRIDLMPGEFACGLIVMNSHADSSLVDGSTSNKQLATANETDLDSTSFRDTTQLPNYYYSKKDTPSLNQATKQVVQQLRLPQRDKIVVQYANQFVFTLIDSKKILGNFRMTTSYHTSGNGNTTATGSQTEYSTQKHQNELKLDEKSQYFGAMPMAHLMTGQQSAAARQSSLVVSLSDHCVYCLPTDKLTSQARQNIVNRVALDLLSAGANRAPTSSSSLHDSSSNQQKSHPNTANGRLIDIDLDTLSEWHHELRGLPLQMQCFQRQAKGALAPHHQHQQQRERILVGQLLVMSRYSLDLLASSGEHLWHQRFEAPLICLYAYTIESPPPEDAHNKSAASATAAASRSGPSLLVDDDQQTRATITTTAAAANGDSNKPKITLEDQLVSLVCSADSFRDDRSNLVVLKDDQMSWSAVLSSKPSRVWRLNLNRMPGLIAMHDIRHGQLVASYLGTNLKSHSSDTEEDPTTNTDHPDGLEQATPSQLVELERLHEPLFQEARLTSDNLKDDQRKRLLVSNQIEMGSSDGTVMVSTSIRLEPNSTSVVHNILITFEFDDLFKFELVAGNENCGGAGTGPGGQNTECLAPARGVAEVHVGNCWPDRREPIKLEIAFSLASAAVTKLVGVAAMNQLNSDQLSDSQAYQNNTTSGRSAPRLMPKSLKVKQYITFSETHSGTLHQEQEFLLPISVVAQLTHVDYSSGQGQDLGDVLNNLNGYKRPGSKAAAGGGQWPYLYCDLLIGLKCDLITVLQDFVECDLICRGRNLQQQSSTNRPGRDGTSDKTINGSPTTNPGSSSATERLLETLESINMLAQSLDCRIRYMSPSPSSSIAHQSSEELVQPMMISFALRLRYNYPRLSGVTTSSQTTADQHRSVGALDDDGDDAERIVWIHICDLTQSNESNIVTDFLSLHMKDWKEYQSASDSCSGVGGEKVGTDQVTNELGRENNNNNNSRILLSIESQQPMAGVFVLNHLIERISNMRTASTRLDMKLIKVNKLEAQREWLTNDDYKPGVDSGQLAISSTMHDALVAIMNTYETKHKSKLKQLQLDLADEFYKYQTVTDGLLSLSKRLPSLPDDMSYQLNELVMQTKKCQLKLTGLLDELESLKRADFELTKLPAAPEIRIEKPSTKLNSKTLVSWCGFSPVI